jgi:hypothetical protein
MGVMSMWMRHRVVNAGDSGIVSQVHGKAALVEKTKQILYLFAIKLLANESCY